MIKMINSVLLFILITIYSCNPVNVKKETEKNFLYEKGVSLGNGLTVQINSDNVVKLNQINYIHIKTDSIDPRKLSFTSRGTILKIDTNIPGLLFKYIYRQTPKEDSTWITIINFHENKQVGKIKCKVE